MKRFEGLDGVRGIGALGVVAYHVFVIGGYQGYNGFFDRTVGDGGTFVRMFFVLSSFSIMCGYAEKLLNGTFDLEVFYKKRIKKLLPGLGIAVIAHWIINTIMHAKSSIWNMFGTMTLLYCLMPTNQESFVWAGWALGVEAIFYLIFPAFFVANKNKKRSWGFFLISLVLLASYINFYGVGAENSHINIIRQLIYFALGALIYHYVDDILQLSQKQRKFLFVICVVLEFAGYILLQLVNRDLVLLMVFGALIINQIVNKDIIINNLVTRFLGKISYEIYLFHMVVYRCLDLIGIRDVISVFIEGKIKQFVLHYLVIISITILISWGIQSLFSRRWILKRRLERKNT